jgi:hypothetical protein
MPCGVQEEILQRYSKACMVDHERHTNDDVSMAFDS